MTNSEFKAADVSRARRPVPWVRWVLYAAVTAIILYFLWICSKNPNFEWGVVAQYFTHDSILHGIKMTLGLTVVSMVIGTVLGLICALGKLSGSRFSIRSATSTCGSSAQRRCLCSCFSGTTSRRCSPR